MLSVVLELTYNVAILVAMVLISGFVRQFQWTERRQALVQGLLFGAATLIGMANPLVLGPGLIFDARSVMISLCALFFGPLAVSVTVALALAYRIALGGVGLYTGGMVIVASAGWGLYFHRHWRRNAQPVHGARLLQLGLLVHVTELLLFLSLPAPLAWQTLETVGLPILLAFPLLTLLMGKVLSSQDAEIQSVAALRKSEAQHRAILQTAMNGFWMADLQGRLLEVNQAYVRMSGYSMQELLDMQITELEASRSSAEIATHIQKVMAIGGDRFETLHRGKDGKIFDVEVSVQYLATEGGRLVAFLNDITENKKAQQRMLLTANVFTHAREGIMITDAAGLIVDVNESFTRITGYGRHQALGKTTQILRSDRHPAAFFEAMWSSLNHDGQWNGEVWNRRQNGEDYAVMLNISAVRDSRGQVQNYVALLLDITAIKAHQRELENLAHYDLLTGLPNRVLLADRLNHAMAHCERRKQKLTVVYLDLDGFKSINDQHGHELGDFLLKQVTSRMKQALREGDTLARIGGDEFVAVLIDLNDRQMAEALLNRLLAAAAEPFLNGELLLQISASVGVTFYPQAEAVEADQLLRQADQAMYQAK
ncbi:MAG TPA: diguanylate cyclase, partial [Rhodoferax sp.]|nr:diguanylate cyclase [Rhodoferax sp.]